MVLHNCLVRERCWIEGATLLDTGRAIIHLVSSYMLHAMHGGCNNYILYAVWPRPCDKKSRSEHQTLFPLFGEGLGTRLGTTLIRPFPPWYNGMGWTIGTGHSKWDIFAHSLSVHSFPSTVRWDNVYLGMFPPCASTMENMAWDETIGITNPNGHLLALLDNPCSSHCFRQKSSSQCSCSQYFTVLLHKNC